tara:strand:+ start:385 stop:591 length:207 start_codon:yes stop_codon:yes gene_type:complete
MDILVLQEGMYHLYPVTKAMFQGATRPEIVDCFSLCDILREKLAVYLSEENRYVMHNGWGDFFGCICK